MFGNADIKECDAISRMRRIGYNSVEYASYLMRWITDELCQDELVEYVNKPFVMAIIIWSRRNVDVVRSM